ncbi:MAG TPA: hypothetical protein VIY49_19760 [Bryobacteraceae bacterium]
MVCHSLVSRTASSDCTGFNQSGHPCRHEFFDQARRYERAKTAGDSNFKIDLKLEAILPVLDGRLPVAISAEREPAISDAIEFADRQKIRMILLAPRELGKAAAKLKERNIPVVLGRTLDLPLHEDDPYDSAFTLPAQAWRGLEDRVRNF